MNNIRLYIHTDEQKNGEWHLCGHLDFEPMDTRWMLEGKIPEEHNIVPWQPFKLPSGEKISVGVVFDDPERNLSLHVKTFTRPILEVITKGHPCLRFLSPGGTDVSLQIHEEED